MNIQEYIDRAKELNSELYRNQSAAEVLLKSRSNTITDWTLVLQKGGYHSVVFRKGEWSRMHVWCQENFGKNHYTWSGSTFWFETEKDAAWYALHWA
jgi:hypothetical protein